MEAAPALAGQSAGLIDKIKSAQQIIEETVAQFFAITPTRPASPQSAQHFLSPRSRLFAAAGASWVVGAACAVDRRFGRISVVDAARGHVKINLD
jgi:hypothetical protein